MAVELEGLRFEIESDSQGAADGIDKLCDSLKRLKKAVNIEGLTSLSNSLKAISSMPTDFSGLETLFTSLETFSSKNLDFSWATDLQQLADSLTSLSNITIPDTIAPEISNIAQAVASITQQSITNLNNMVTALTNLSNINIQQLQQVISAAKQTGNINAGGSSRAQNSTMQQTTTNANQTTSALTRLRSVLSTIGKVIATPFKLGASAARALTTVLQKLHNVFSKIKNVITKVANGFKKIATAIKKVVSVAKSAVSHFRELGDSLGDRMPTALKSTTAKFGQLLSSMKRIVMYRAIRSFFSQLVSAMKEGIENLYQYSALTGGTFKDSMDSIATSFQYLKNSMAAMVSPLINALAPAIDYVIDKFVDLLNVINQFIAKITGSSTYTKAVKSATTYADTLSDTADAATDAAEEITDATTGIDELNIISQDDDTDTSSGSSSSDSTDYSTMFETAEIEDSISEFVENIKSMIADADWEGIGELLGTKFNDLVDSIDWDYWGTQIGYAINGVASTIYYTLETIDFNNLGASLADAVNAALEQIDFTIIGALFVEDTLDLIDIMIGFLGELNWSLVGESIGDFLRGAFDTVTNWVQKYDWGEMADTAFQSLKDCLLGVDFASVAQSFFTMLGSALAAAVSYIATFILDIGEAIRDYFLQFIEDENGDGQWGAAEIISGLCEGIVNAVKNIGKWIKENIFEPFIEGFKSVFGISSPSTVMEEQGGYLIEGLLEGIVSAIKSIPTWIKENVCEPIVEAFKNFFGIDDDSSSVFSGIGESVVNGFSTGLGLFSGIASTVKGWAGSVVEWFTAGEDGSGLVENFKTVAGNVISGFGNKISTTYTNAKTGITTWASNVKSWFSSSSYGGICSSTFQTYASNIVSGFKSKVSSTYTNAKSSITTWASNVKSWFTSYCSKDSFYTIASNVVTGFKNGIGALYTTCKSTITSWGSSIISWFKSKLGISSPSKVFKNMGIYTVEGFDYGLDKMLPQTYKKVGEWASDITKYQPTLSLEVDTSALEYYDSTEFARSISANVESNVKNTNFGFKEAMIDFYREYLEETIETMASDMKRQADKEETVNLKIGNRTITNTVNSQRLANGYSFTG